MPPDSAQKHRPTKSGKVMSAANIFLRAFTFYGSLDPEAWSVVWLICIQSRLLIAIAYPCARLK
jgi:hypothetical protein